MSTRLRVKCDKCGVRWWNDDSNDASNTLNTYVQYQVYKSGYDGREHIHQEYDLCNLCQDDLEEFLNAVPQRVAEKN